jgi:hypothetical protein
LAENRPLFNSTRREFLQRLTVAGTATALLPGVAATATAKPKWPRRRILFFSKSVGFEHSVVKRAGDKLSHAEQVLADLASQHNFAFTFSKDGSQFSPDYLAPFDVIMFYAAGHLFEVGPDHAPAMTPAGKAALLSAVTAGKGFVGLHPSTDPFHSPNFLKGGAARWRDDGPHVDPYLAMLGGEFVEHGPQQKARLRCTSPKFPGMEKIADGFEMLDEWYSQKNFASDLHVILVQETQGMEGKSYARPPFPSTWARRHGRGRVFYTSLGHREDVWTHPTFQAILTGGTHWAARDVDADLTPNLKTAAPRCHETPVE